jgi:hypothetical protein
MNLSRKSHANTEGKLIARLTEFHRQHFLKPGGTGFGKLVAPVLCQPAQ